MDFTIQFPRGYIAHPYWVAREQVINITKASGTNRAKTEANRVKALSNYLDAIKMTPEEYRSLEAMASRPFYTAADVEHDDYFGDFALGDHDPTEIVIPPIQCLACLTAGSAEARAGIRIVAKEQARSSFQTAPIYTGKLTADGTWERYAKLEASNQRGFRSNPYIRDFSAVWSITADANITREKLLTFLGFVGREVGIGASRKLGWGRFTVE